MYKVHNTAMSMYMSMCESESVSGLTNSPLEKSVQLWKDKPARLIIDCYLDLLLILTTNSETAMLFNSRYSIKLQSQDSFALSTIEMT